MILLFVPSINILCLFYFYSRSGAYLLGAYKCEFLNIVFCVFVFSFINSLLLSLAFPLLYFSLHLICYFLTT